MPAFHQIEGLWVDEQATFADLKGVLRTLLVQLFGSQTAVRFRPSYFPFTEPSCEVDVSCVDCRGQPSATCRICRGTGWLEVRMTGVLSEGRRHGLSSRLGQNRADVAHQPLDPILVGGPWVLAGGAAVLGLRALLRRR